VVDDNSPTEALSSEPILAKVLLEYYLAEIAGAPLALSCASGMLDACNSSGPNILSVTFLILFYRAYFDGMNEGELYRAI
jgi:hypothetical protein